MLGTKALGWVTVEAALLRGNRVDERGYKRSSIKREDESGENDRQDEWWISTLPDDLQMAVFKEV